MRGMLSEGILHISLWLRRQRKRRRRRKRKREGGGRRGGEREEEEEEDKERKEKDKTTGMCTHNSLSLNQCSFKSVLPSDIIYVHVY